MNTVAKNEKYNGKVKDMIEEEIGGTVTQRYRTNQAVSAIKRGTIDYSVWDAEYVPPITDGPTPTDTPNNPTTSPTTPDEPEDWDLNNNGVVNLYDFNIFIRRILNGNQDWSNISQFIEAFRAQSE